jgi:hypothetical protein
MARDVTRKSAPARCARLVYAALPGTATNLATRQPVAQAGQGDGGFPSPDRIPPDFGYSSVVIVSDTDFSRDATGVDRIQVAGGRLGSANPPRCAAGL